jgi:hypothetical protein
LGKITLEKWVHKSLKLLKCRSTRRVLKGQRAEELKVYGPLDPERHMATDRELWVEALWENVKEKSLKSPKPEQPK